MSKPTFGLASKPKIKNKQALKTTVANEIVPKSIRMLSTEKDFFTRVINQIQIENGRKITTAVLMRAILTAHMKKDEAWYQKAILDLTLSATEVKTTSIRFTESELLFMSDIAEKIQPNYRRKISTTLIIRSIINQVSNKSTAWFIKAINDLSAI